MPDIPLEREVTPLRTATGTSYPACCAFHSSGGQKDRKCRDKPWSAPPMIEALYDELCGPTWQARSLARRRLWNLILRKFTDGPIAGPVSVTITREEFMSAARGEVVAEEDGDGPE